jgi:hypothetical protein
MRDISRPVTKTDHSAKMDDSAVYVIRRGNIDSMLAGRTPDEARDMKKRVHGDLRRAIVPTKGRVSSGYRNINLLSDFLVSMGI